MHLGQVVHFQTANEGDLHAEASMGAGALKADVYAVVDRDPLRVRGRTLEAAAVATIRPSYFVDSFRSHATVFFTHANLMRLVALFDWHTLAETFRWQAKAALAGVSAEVEACSRIQMGDAATQVVRFMHPLVDVWHILGSSLDVVQTFMILRFFTVDLTLFWLLLFSMGLGGCPHSTACSSNLTELCGDACARSVGVGAIHYNIMTINGH